MMRVAMCVWPGVQSGGCTESVEGAQGGAERKGGQGEGEGRCMRVRGGRERRRSASMCHDPCGRGGQTELSQSAAEAGRRSLTSSSYFELVNSPLYRGSPEVREPPPPATHGHGGLVRGGHGVAADRRAPVTQQPNRRGGVCTARIHFSLLSFVASLVLCRYGALRYYT